MTDGHIKKLVLARKKELENLWRKKIPLWGINYFVLHLTER